MRHALLTLLVLLSLESVGQVDCEEFYMKQDSSRSRGFSGWSIATPKNGHEEMFKQIFDRIMPFRDTGLVHIQLVVDTSGNVQCPRIIKTTNEELTEMAVYAVEELKFIPAVKNGNKILSTYSIPIRFRANHKK